MSLFKRLLTKSRQTKSDVQFRRFLSIRYPDYANLCVFGPAAYEFYGAEGIAAACREWLPSLTSKLDREICESIAKYHESSSEVSASIDSLMGSLDQLPAFACGPTASRRRTATVVDEAETVSCDYCGSAIASATQFLSGEPTAVCDSMSCLSKHDELMCIDSGEFREVGLIGRTYN